MRRRVNNQVLFNLNKQALLEMNDNSASKVEQNNTYATYAFKRMIFLKNKLIYLFLPDSEQSSQQEEQVEQSHILPGGSRLDTTLAVPVPGQTGQQEDQPIHVEESELPKQVKKAGKRKKRLSRTTNCQGGADWTLPWQSLVVRGMLM